MKFIIVENIPKVDEPNGYYGPFESSNEAYDAADKMKSKTNYRYKIQPLCPVNKKADD